MGARLWQTLRLGLKSLLLHKLRSALAIFGILIGVTAVIWLVAMGEGVSYQAQEQIKSLGANNIIVRSLKPPDESSRSGRQSPVIKYGLLRDDLELIERNVPGLKAIVPLREVLQEARYGDQAASVRLVGCTRQYPAMNGLTLAYGRFLTDRDGDRHDNVCVLAAEAAARLFLHEDPLGQAVQIGREFYVVVGVTEHRDPTGAIGSSLSGQDYNQDIYIPLETLRARLGDLVSTARTGSMGGEEVQLSQITVTVEDFDAVDDTASLIRSLLAPRHPTGDFGLVVPKDLLQQAEVLQTMFNVLLVLIAGIALLVGGIGIMNIMLATVTERTREIGIRRALGARRSDIVEQFLSEATVLSATGGLLGVAVGFLCGPAVRGVRWLFDWLAPELVAALPHNVQELAPRIAPWSVVAAFTISVAVGVLFGLYPARRAALLDPIEALRHE